MKNSYAGYKIVSSIVVFVGNMFFRGKVINKKYIPKDGPVILAGNHVSDYDSYLLFKSSERPIHFLAKKELIDGKLGWFFKMMHLIRIDRSIKNPAAKEEVINLLNNNKIIGIFPEGTYRKKNLLLPFKGGVISFAEKTNAPIIPFVIKGKFRFWSKPTITFGKPIHVDKLKGNKLQYLQNVIFKMLKK